MRTRTQVFLTGATGNWGRFILDEFRRREDRFDVVALVLPTAADRRTIGRYSDMSNLRVVYGDLTDYPAVETCVRGSDFVLHVGGLVSPASDDNPELTHKVNTGSMRNIVRAVLTAPDPSRIGVVGIGSIAQTGDRNPPHHWGRIGDPMKPAHYDEYGQSKIIAEKTLVDSGLPKWVSLRQTGIFHPGMMEIRDPILTHSPFGAVMEWTSAEDSARLIVNICEDGVPPEFWRDIYNIGGGAAWRLTNWQLQTKMTAAVGVKDFRRWYDRNWFATRNFHGHWYTDSDELQKMIPFREDSFDAALARAVALNPGLRMAGRIPPWIVKRFFIRPLTVKQRGTMRYLRDGNEQAICAYFGSREEFESIGDWSSFEPPEPDLTPSYLDHGYDESKPRAEWCSADYAAAARFRGGELLTEGVAAGNVAEVLRWRCGFGHEFDASPLLVLRAGHWCPTCVRDTFGFDDQASRSAFLAQVQQAKDVPQRLG